MTDLYVKKSLSTAASDQLKEDKTKTEASGICSPISYCKPMISLQHARHDESQATIH